MLGESAGLPESAGSNSPVHHLSRLEFGAMRVFHLCRRYKHPLTTGQTPARLEVRTPILSAGVVPSFSSLPTHIYSALLCEESVVPHI